MKRGLKLFSLAIMIFAGQPSYQQVKIHAHNDYEKPMPLMNALHNKVYSIEADVFLRNSRLLVAHSKDELDPEKTLDALYIKPIVSLFKKNRGQVSEDTSYRFSLMIDVKEGGENTIKQLVKSISRYRSYFDRRLNRNAVQVIISGDRGNIANWKKQPRYIFFDGRPYEKYDAATLQKIAIVSDGYASYAENREKLKAALSQAHQWGKLFRFWGSPDNEFSWNNFLEAGIDIINTDKPEVCRRFFDEKRE